ncbi:hypothetical protein CFK39_05750 [Brachybacterium avium]|uniref:Uncharacterized protein n=1 Tax=Brachybacterium avium TaxID=2017485 RepID=A0A220UB42_9MICO|nr:PQQ-binding-like beta-propeller repeat protein [Brachybacterium avium]ASK65418.1 hypothetical protein CFK39_05750 [Brachybacterium avium]
MTARAAGFDRTTAFGAAVVLLALAGICVLLGSHFVLGALRLAAGILAGLGVGVTLFAVLSGRRARPAPRPRILVAAGAALATALALTVPAVLATRVDPLEDRAAAGLEALAEGDAVHSLPGPDSPVLVHRAEGAAEVLIGSGVHHVDATTHDVLALSADGQRLVRATGASTEVLLLDPTASDPEGRFPSQTFEGTPLALAGDRIVLRSCTEGFCRASGFDLTAPEEPLWVVSASAETRGTDPAGVEVPARAEQPPGLLDALRTTGVMPTVPLSFDPGQGWVQLDLATGFPVGRIIAGPEDECRIAATDEAVGAADPLHASPLVLTVCSADDGALTATAFRDGAVLWESAPSPAGDWSVRLDQGRVLATGTETDSTAVGEIIASEQRADWTAPGGAGMEQAAAFTTRIGIDGAAMVVTNPSGQLLAYELADGANTWTLPLDTSGTEVRGTLEAGTAVVMDGARREQPLQPRSTRRLRVIDAATGEVTFEARVAEEIDAVRAVGGGRALVTVDGQTLLLGA